MPQVGATGVFRAHALICRDFHVDGLDVAFVRCGCSPTNQSATVVAVHRGTDLMPSGRAFNDRAHQLYA